MRTEITDAARAAGRAPEEITLIAVTKYHPVELLDELYALGVRDFGENRHPESRDKANHLHERYSDARLHFIGQLQRNKARQVGRYADCIQSIDRLELVDALAKLERGDHGPLEVAIQLSLDGDSARGGVALDEATALAEAIAAVPTLKLAGVMAVAPLGAETEEAFATARSVGERIRDIVPDATMVSMGMSHDFRSAISQGATHLRIGTAITGNRPDRP
ncbi:YggS family pyridoxal phosphate-dependent enzyme [Gulosibacter molinativorax]|uniref:Pyridoxal phosphate homeostasis protein n=1 Tax=Gulosibacter molinativorax TaxID=256821 RepID=A0ABT7C5C8_9MICO|nr:YggS family pyridoxal phosphate-dependent enzyme [Gulosibacter molinativorax]